MARGERLAPARGGERTRSPLDCGRCGELVWCAGVVAVRVTDCSLAVCLLWLFVWLGVGGGAQG